MHAVRFESQRDFKTCLFSHRGAHYLYLVDNISFFLLLPPSAMEVVLKFTSRMPEGKAD